MFSYARAETEAGGRALLLTADRDLYQAVDEHTTILELHRQGPASEIDVSEVRRRYGIAPEQVPDFIALRGDPSDNLPGAPASGRRPPATCCSTTARWRVRSPARVRERPRVSASLRDNADLLRTFRRIATLERIPVSRPADQATDFGAGASAARELGLSRLAGRLERLARAPA